MDLEVALSPVLHKPFKPLERVLKLVSLNAKEEKRKKSTEHSNFVKGQTDLDKICEGP